MKLLFTNGPLDGNKYLVDRRITIGRHLTNDIVIPDPSVSLIHCKISFENGVGFIQDQGSTNGIHLNGKRLISTKLCDGDILHFGQISAKVEMDAPGEQPAPTDRDEDTPKENEEHKELSGNIFGSVTYFLQRKIADGGMGAVYEALQFGAEGFIKKVAIKTILPEFVTRDVFVSAFIGEARLVANLVHENIVQIHHLDRHDNGYYIAMEYIEGISLTEFMLEHDRQGRAIPHKIATFIVSRICRGLEYAHEKCDDNGQPLNLVHRDVSPNNVMITKEGEVKLTDFGVAKAAQYMEEEDGVIVGSLEYMSPEQASVNNVDARSDIYSLGLIYYELLTGIRIFAKNGEDVHVVLERVRNPQIPDPRENRSDLPEDTVGILMRSLEKDVEDRYQSAGDMAFELENELYSGGYGPTIVTLARYIERLYRPD